jgi:FMN hydrolase / 5-amino-6-(5-phospho-D-ribitylamino)uracil phosphatase
MLEDTMLNIRAVAFDLDNTLWDVGPVIARAEQYMMAWLREHAPRITERVTLEQMRAAREQLALREPHHAHDLVYLRVATLTRLARESGYEESLAGRAFEVFHHARNDVELFPDVAPALMRLRGRYVLATLSNGTADLVRIGLASFFTVRLGAREIGFAKPHPRCFERLACDLGVAPGEILYVGDDPLLDVNAARGAGMRTAWMNRRALVWPAELPPADVVVTECGALAAQLS